MKRFTIILAVAFDLYQKASGAGTIFGQGGRARRRAPTLETRNKVPSLELERFLSRKEAFSKKINKNKNKKKVFAGLGVFLSQK